MAEKGHFSHGTVEIYGKEVLGCGSFGEVCKAKCGQLTCAAKKLHDSTVQFAVHDQDPGLFKFVEKFEQECRFLMIIDHPNIVQFLGTHRNPQSQRLALLMELMDESLTGFLERSTGPLPYHTQLNICQDVALALAYLHSNDIIHRDLSSNNVLLMCDGGRAKVTDFGMSRLVDPKKMAQLTMCPGTLTYMPPEALITPPQYTNRLDCFSHGVLTIQIITRNSPNPGGNCAPHEDSNLFRRIPETERRKKDIDLVAPDHPLLPLALHCLKDKDVERPLADELCIRLATLKQEPRYTESEKQNSVQTLRLKIQEKDDELNAKDCTIDRVMKDSRAALDAKTAEYERKLNASETLIEQLRKENCELLRKQEQQTPRAESEMPETMISFWGAAVVQDRTAYFSVASNVYSYTLPEGKWYTLERCENAYFGLAIVNDKLTAIGGSHAGTTTNTLLSLTSTWIPFFSSMEWKQLLPPMPTEREVPAAVTTPTHLVVAGGRNGPERNALSTVEVLDVKAELWSSASGSPEPLRCPSMELCGEYFYLSEDSAVFSCSVKKLLESSSSTNSNGAVSVWARLQDIPTPYETSLTSLRGQILAVGGSGKKFGGTPEPSGTIYCYHRNTNSWSDIGEMSTPREATLVAVLSSNELVMVGGRDASGPCKVIETAYL